MNTLLKLAATIGLVALIAGCAKTAEPEPDANTLSPQEAREIAREAYTYANPVVDSYRILHSSFVDRNDPEYKAPWNQLKNIARVYTPHDKALQTPNTDTPYSWLAMDLRTEPLVLTVPQIEKARYYSIQLIDLYTHIFDYIGTRTTGNDGGSFLIAGPSWEGKTPGGITKIIRSETDLAVALYRTQLFNPGDLKKVKDIQAGYKVQPLSAFLGQPAPEAAPAIDFIEPLTRDEIRTSPRVFEQLNFLLQFCPTHQSEEALMKRFAKLGIGAGKTFDIDKFTPETRPAIGEGIADSWAHFTELMKRGDTGEIDSIGSGDIFGSREHLKNNYAFRMGAAVTGIWGNSAEEAVYPSYRADAKGRELDGAHRYRLRFAPDKLPPVDAFWSLTMYQMPESLLAENPINRYLLNSTMLPDFVRDADGGITLYIQHEPPGKEQKPNWLPAPSGPFFLVLRLYLPKAEVLKGTWEQPPLSREKMHGSN
jgi:hypothetical protein